MAPKAPASTTSAKQSAISKPSKSTTSGRVKKPKSTPKTTTSKPKAPAKKAEKPVSAASNKRKKDDSENEEAAQDRAVKRTKKTVVKNKTAQAKTATKTTTQRITSSNVIDEMKSTAGTGSVVISGTKDKETAAFEPQRSHNMQADTVKVASEKKMSSPKKLATIKAPPRKSVKKDPEINFPPTKLLHTFVFGEGSQGELGLGAKNDGIRKVIDVKYPRLNGNLENLNVVQLAVGGMHVAALTSDNKIYTWGVNDQGALGRRTFQEGRMISLPVDGDEVEEYDSDTDDEEDEDSGLNPAEAEPREIDTSDVPEGTRWASLFAGDSTTFALTTTGLVYGWGTFRGNDGVLGFNKDSKDGKKTQSIPTLIPELRLVKTMAIGTNHALALTHKGKAYVWGAGEQSQLGRRVVARTAAGGLVPREFGFQRKKIVGIATGDYFSFAIQDNGTVYAWGHNGYGQTGISIDQNIDDIVPVPTVVDSLKGEKIQQMAGGTHHTIARTTDGAILVWGRLDNCEGGVKIEDMPEDSVIRDLRTNRVLASKKPIVVPNLKAKLVATGNDTCFAITEEGQAYSWGFSVNYQTGQGSSDDIVEASLVDNTAVRGKKLTFAGVGGQFGVLACEKEDSAPHEGV